MRGRGEGTKDEGIEAEGGKGKEGRRGRMRRKKGRGLGRRDIGLVYVYRKCWIMDFKTYLKG